MNIARWLMLVTVVGALVAGSACTQKAADDAKREGDVALDAAKQGADNAVDATREAGEQTAEVAQNIAQKTADKTTEIATAVENKTIEVVSATGEAITDGWITTTVSAGFVGEALLKGSNINVDTRDHVVTLKGVVGSDAAKVRAVAIARGTKGVARVVDQLVVS